MGGTIELAQRPSGRGASPPWQGDEETSRSQALRHPTPLSEWGLPRGPDNADLGDEACGHDGESGGSPAPGGHACAAVGGTGVTCIGGVILTPELSLRLSDRDEFRVPCFMSLPLRGCGQPEGFLQTASGTGSASILGYQPRGAEPLTFLRTPSIRRDHWREDHPTPAAALRCPTRHCAYRNRRHITANLYEREHRQQGGVGGGHRLHPSRGKSRLNRDLATLRMTVLSLAGLRCHWPHMSSQGSGLAVGRTRERIES